MMMINKVDEQHKELIKYILANGTQKHDRTGVGTLSIFGYQLRYNMSDGFPLLTLRKIHTKSIINEMLWFLGAFDQEKYSQFGNTNIKYLLDNGTKIWTDWPYQSYNKKRKYRPELPELSINEFENKIIIDDAFAKEFGSIGPGYGKQWLDFGGKVERKSSDDGSTSFIVTPGVNQIDYIIDILKKDPDSRRMVLNAWKADEIDDMLLPPCHNAFQLYTHKINPKERFQLYSEGKNISELKPMLDFPERKVSMMLNIRSNDLGLGNPFNVAEYAILLHMFAQVSNMIPGELIINLGDVHIYNNHVEQMKKLLERSSYDLPTLILNKNIKNIYDFRYEDIKIDGYQSHPNIKMDVAV